MVTVELCGVFMGCPLWNDGGCDGVTIGRDCRAVGHYTGNCGMMFRDEVGRVENRGVIHLLCPIVSEVVSVGLYWVGDLVDSA